MTNVTFGLWRSAPDHTVLRTIESVQRRYTKRLPRYSVLDYPTRLKSLEQYSLEKRRIVHDLVLTYKIIFRLAQTSKFFKLRDDIVPTRGNPYKIVLNTSRMNVRRHFLLNVLPVCGTVCHRP